MRVEGNSDFAETSTVATVPVRFAGRATTASLSDLAVRPPFSTLFPVDAKTVARIASSMKEGGYSAARPILARTAEDGALVVVDGHQRLEAARLAGIDEIPVFVLGAATEREALEIAIREQRDRRNMTGPQRAACVLRALDALEALAPAATPEAQQRGLRRGDAPVSSIEPTGPTVTEKVADLTGVPVGTVKKVAVVARHGDEETKAAVLAEKLTVDAAYRRTREAKDEKVVVVKAKKTSPPAGEDVEDPRLADLDALLASLAKPGRGKKGSTRTVVVLAEAVVRLVRALGEVAVVAEISFGNRPEYLDAIVETMTEAIDAIRRHGRTATRLAKVYGVTPKEVVEAGELVGAIEKIKVVDPEIEKRFVNGGVTREEVFAKARTLEATPAGQTCIRCGGTAPLGERIPHGAPCVKAPAPKVAAGTFWMNKTARHPLFVESVEGDVAKIRFPHDSEAHAASAARILVSCRAIKPTSRLRKLFGMGQARKVAR